MLKNNSIIFILTISTVSAACLDRTPNEKKRFADFRPLHKSSYDISNDSSIAICFMDSTNRLQVNYEMLVIEYREGYNEEDIRNAQSHKPDPTGFCYLSLIELESFNQPCVWYHDSTMFHYFKPFLLKSLSDTCFNKHSKDITLFK